MNSKSQAPSRPNPDRWAGEAPLRLLVGPYVAPQHCEYMRGAFDDYEAITFGSWSESDVILPPSADFQTVLESLPAGFEPDLMIWWRPEYTSIPRGLEAAPFPVVMLTSDWYLAWHDTLAATDWADLVVTGTRGERVFRTAGLDNVVALPMLGFEPGLDGAYHSPQRDIDVLCAGNPKWSIHTEREHVTHALFDLPPSVNFQHPPYMDRVQYNHALGRTKIFVNQTVIGEINMKCYEVPASGACLFVERDNLDITDYLVDGESVVLFDRHDVVEKVLYYLAHEDERAAIAEAGHEAMRSRSYRQNMCGIVEHVRSIGRDALLARPRPIVAKRPLDVDRQHAAHSVHRLICDDGHGLAGVDACTRSGTGRDVAIRAVAHLRARIVASALKVSTPALPVDAARQLVADAHEKGADDLCLALLAHHLWVDRDENDELTWKCFEKVVELVEAGPDLSPVSSFVLGLHEDRRFLFERATWEAIEAGCVPRDLQRAHLLDACIVPMALREERLGRDESAITLLERAIAAHPDGRRARPALAAIQTRHRRFDRAAATLTDHLRIHPLDDAATLGRIMAWMQCGEIDITRQSLGAFRRRMAIFGNDEWTATLSRIDAMLTRLAPRPARETAAGTTAEAQTPKR